MCETIDIGTKSKCTVCGNTFSNNKVGRSREYCSDNCKDLNKYLNAMERHLIKVNFVGTSANFFKGEIMRRANLIVCVSNKK